MTAAPEPNAGFGAADAFPWDAAMSAGFCLLRLSSAEFWRMTPRELARALVPFGRGAGEPLGRSSLDAMMRQFPDRRSTP